MVLKCLYSQRIGRPDIFWSKNCMEVTEYNKASDKRLVRSTVPHPFYEWFSKVVSCGKQCVRVQIGSCFMILTSQVAWPIEINVRRNGMHLRKSHRFVPSGWSFNKQTVVSHSSTEAEIISLDANLRLEGIPALNVWDMVLDAFGISSWETSHAEQNHKEEVTHIERANDK